MEIEFENIFFEKCLIDEAPTYKTLCKKVDKGVLKALIKRKNQLKAADNFLSFLTTGLGKIHHMENNMKGYYAVNITANYRLIMKPKSTNLSSEVLKICDTVILKGVDDYHGKNENWILP